MPTATVTSQPAVLAPWACDPGQSRGRRHPQAPAPTRSEFQRDRDRVIHSSAFRRLVYKTQVFLNHEGDLFRTRLTHSLEVAQLARSVARTLRLNEDLVEAIALAHDLGHTPFGHAGQDALHARVLAWAEQADLPQESFAWGFEHNLQSLRVVDELEERYPQFDGLNLSFETREGVLKHCARRDAISLERREPGGVGWRFVHGGSPSLEAQLCNLADEIAYNAHDIDDGVRSGLLALEQVGEVPLFGRYLAAAQQDHPGLQGRRLLFEATRLMLSEQVYDLIRTSQARIEAAQVDSVDAVRQLPQPLIAFSAEMRSAASEMKRFLHRNLYRHPQVTDTTERAKQVLNDLFDRYMADPSLGPAPSKAGLSRLRCVADHIAGMTDRFALREHERLTGLRLF